MPLEQTPLDRLVSGDKAAWDAFVGDSAPVVRAVVRQILLAAGREQDTADVTQDVFVRLCRDGFRLLRQYEPKRARLSTWLGVIASSAAIDHLRRADPHGNALQDLAEEDLPGVEPAEPRRPLALPSDLLTARQILILKLLYEDDCSVEEAAHALGIEAQTIRSQRHKAFTKLRAWLADRAMDR